MNLKGNLVVLRATEPSDLELLYRWENDVSNWNVSGTQTPYSEFILEQYLATAHHDIYTSKQLRLVIEKNDETKKAVGCIDLFDFNAKHRRAGVGILIGEEEERGKGYASEALQLLMDYALKFLDIHQLFANISADNTKSLALFKKHQFKICGTKKDWLYLEGRWTDEHLLQYIAE